MNIHKTARLTPLGRERLVKMMLCGHTGTGRRTSLWGFGRGPRANG